MVDDLKRIDLQASERAFQQDLHPWVARTASAPGCRRLNGVHVVTLRHAASSPLAREAMQRLNLPWPAATGELEVTAGTCGTVVVRRQPEELLLVGPASGQAEAPLAPLLAALAPGQASDSVAVDLTHGMLVLALEGPQLEPWLSHLVDARAIPCRNGSATRTRLVDVAVLLMRLDTETVWLVVDRTLAPYLANWLAFTHEATFSTPPT